MDRVRQAARCPARPLGHPKVCPLRWRPCGRTRRARCRSRCRPAPPGPRGPAAAAHRLTSGAAPRPRPGAVGGGVRHTQRSDCATIARRAAPRNFRGPMSNTASSRRAPKTCRPWRRRRSTRARATLRRSRHRLRRPPDLDLPGHDADALGARPARRPGQGRHDRRGLHRRTRVRQIKNPRPFARGPSKSDESAYDLSISALSLPASSGSRSALCRCAPSGASPPSATTTPCSPRRPARPPTPTGTTTS